MFVGYECCKVPEFIVVCVQLDKWEARAGPQGSQGTRGHRCQGTTDPTQSAQALRTGPTSKPNQTILFLETLLEAERCFPCIYLCSTCRVFYTSIRDVQFNESSEFGEM